MIQTFFVKWPVLFRIERKLNEKNLHFISFFSIRNYYLFLFYRRKLYFNFNWSLNNMNNINFFLFMLLVFEYALIRRKQEFRYVTVFKIFWIIWEKRKKERKKMICFSFGYDYKRRYENLRVSLQSKQNTQKEMKASLTKQIKIIK